LYIHKVKICNYRNFTEFESELEKFSVIIGPNNIGKSNFLKAINLALSPYRTQVASLIDTDFYDQSKPIIIEITFKGLQPQDYPGFKNYLNPNDDSLTIRFEATYKNELLEYEIESYFINNSLGEEDRKLDPFTNRHKESIFFRYIDADRDFKSEIFSSKNSLTKLIRSNMPFYSCSYNTLQKQILNKIEIMRKIYEENQIDYIKIDELKKKLIEIFKNEPIFEQEIQLIDSICNQIQRQLRSLSNQYLRDELLMHLEKQIRPNILQIYFRDKIRSSLKGIDTLITQNSEFYSLNKKLEEKIISIIGIEKVKFSMEPDHEEYIFKKIELLIDEVSLKLQGRGYQNIIILILIIMDAIIKCMNNESIGTFILAIEELENHLYPSMQRTLMDFIKKWVSDIKNISSQFILTTHSPNIIRNINFNQLVKFNRDNSNIYSIKLTDNIIELIIANRQIQQNKKSKWEKGLWNSFNLLFSKHPEVFLVKTLIVSEGPSEEGAFPVIGKKLKFDFDRNEIKSICCYGDGNLDYIMAVLDAFKIDYLAVRDKDKKSERENHDWIKNNPKRFITNEKDFEYEFVESLNLIDILNLILTTWINSCHERISHIKGILEFTKCNNIDEISKRYNDPNLSNSGKNELKKLVLKWMKKHKSRYFGFRLAELLKDDGSDVPKKYREMIYYIISKRRSLGWLNTLNRLFSMINKGKL